MRLPTWPRVRRLLSVILVLALLPAGPVLAQEQVETVVPETVASETTSESDVTDLNVPEQLQRTFDLLRTPGYHPELAELLGVESVIKSVLPIAAPAELQTRHWVYIGVGIGLAVLFIAMAATCGWKGC